MIHRRIVSGIALVALVLCSASIFAQDPNHVVTHNDGSGASGDTVDVTVVYDNTSVDDLSGWSFGVCVDNTVAITTAVAQGADTAATNGGAGPDFHAEAVDPAPNLNGGWTLGVVISFAGMDVLAVGTGLELEVVSYNLVGNAGDSTPADFCDTLGMPLVINTLVDAGGGAIDATENGGTLSILSCNEISVESVTGIVDSTQDVNINLNNCDEVEGFQIALTFDDTDVSLATTTLVGDAAAAEFQQVNVGAGSLTIGVVMDFSDPADGMPGNLMPNTGTVATMTYNIPAGTPAPQTVALNLVDGLGDPAIDTLVVVNGGQADPGNRTDGQIDIVAFNPFVRGDCNDDGIVNIADAIFHLNFLFDDPPAPEPVCDDACDSNDDGDINAITDAVYTINYRFLEGPPPPAPFPTAGIDPTPGDGIGCNGDADDQP